MTQALTDLIRKYEGDLRVEDWKAVDYGKLRDFSLNLIKLDNFPYRIKQMEETMNFVEEKKMGLYSRYTIFEMIMRRKAMNTIRNVEKRKGLWLAIDNYMDKRGNIDVLLVYSARYGIEETKKDLETMLEEYKKMQKQFETLKQKIAKTKDTKRREWLAEVYENHNQVTMTVGLHHIPTLIKQLEKVTEMHRSEEARL